MSSDASGGSRSEHRIQILEQRIAQLEAELWSVRQQSLAQRQRLVQKYGREFLALIDDPHTRATVTDIEQKLVFQDEEGNVVSEADGSLLGKLINVANTTE